jgi:GT2 family glycosyltransferase
MTPKVIVLILSYNGKSLLQECISSYLNNDYSNFEVVVVDNASTDGTIQWVRENYPFVYVHRSDVDLKYSGGFNFGMKYAFDIKNADYVLITNNDVKADNKVIKELIKIADTDPMIGFVTGKVYYYDHPDTLQTVGFYEDPIKWIGGHLGNREKDVGQYDRVIERSYSDDIFILVKKKVYDTVGGYDTEFEYQAEQFDWQIRAKAKGFRIYYTPYAKIWHKDSMTLGKTSAIKTYYNVRNTYIVRLMYREDEYLKQYTKYYLKSVVMKPLIKNIIKLRINHSYYIFSAFLSAIKWGIANKKLKLGYFT